MNTSATSLPEFRRASPEDAFDVARRLFAQGERVDMATLAELLGIGRTTLYRWVGDREQLMGRVIVSVITPTWSEARSEARGRGQERALDSVRRFITAVTIDDDLRGFVQREPSLALKVLMDPDGWVAQTLRIGLATAIREDAGASDTADDTYAVTVQVATSLVWANVAGGLEPRVDAIVDVLRKVLRP